MHAFIHSFIHSFNKPYNDQGTVLGVEEIQGEKKQIQPLLSWGSSCLREPDADKITTTMNS